MPEVLKKKSSIILCFGHIIHKTKFLYPRIPRSSPHPLLSKLPLYLDNNNPIKRFNTFFVIKLKILFCSKKNVGMKEEEPETDREKNWQRSYAEDMSEGSWW